ncbi:MAG: Fur family transcriptional regulator [Candidatus Dormibacteria bacterium]
MARPRLEPHTLLRRAGLRATPQRQLVLDVLSGVRTGHLTADEVWRAAAARQPSFNRSTAYRALDQLCSAGIVQETRFGDSAHFEIVDRPERHHHLVCVRCGSIENVPADLLVDISSRLARRRGFHIGSVELTIQGECGPCRRPRPGAGPVAGAQRPG